MKTKAIRGQSARAALADATARFHLANRRLQQHQRSWRRNSKGLNDVIDAFWTYERVAASPDLVPLDIRERGEEALRRCTEANDRRVELIRARYEALQMALRAMGAYYGELMARDLSGSLLMRFRLYLGKALIERSANIDGVRPKLMSLDDLREFDSMIPWAKALGYRSVGALFTDLRMEEDMARGLRPPCLDAATRLNLL